MTTNSIDPYETGDIVNSDGSKPRDLNVLLKMDSYQDMTDDEIKLVIAWKEKMAYMQASNNASKAALTEAYDTMIAKLKESAKAAQESFERACSIVPAFTRIEDSDAS